MLTIAEALRRNLDEVRERIEQASAAAGRSPSEVTLVAVTKYARLEWVRALLDLGIRDLGESRPQQLVERVPLLDESIRWHMIGHLQRNKVRPVLEHACVIHSVDSLRLLDRIQRIATELDVRPRLLLEVNVSGESSKGGFSPDQLRQEWSEVLEFGQVELVGLMTMAPVVEHTADARPYFRALRELRDELKASSGEGTELPELSMGMSGDFEAAIQEGATMVRVGSRLFENCPEAVQE